MSKMTKEKLEELTDMLEETCPDWPFDFAGKVSWKEWTDPEDKEWNKIYNSMIMFDMLDMCGE